MKMHEALGIQTLYNSISGTKLPIKTAYKFTRLAKQLEGDIEFYQNKFREILNDCAEKDENGEFKVIQDGRSFAIVPGKEEECNQRVAELYSLDIKVEGVEFTIEELDGVNVSPQELSCLMSLIKD